MHGQQPIADLAWGRVIPDLPKDPMQRRNLCLLTICMVALAACGQDNRPPLAFGQAVSLEEDSFTSGNVTAHDADDDSVTFVVDKKPTRGTLTFSYPTGAYTYTPAHDFNGSDSFAFRAWDGKEFSDRAVVTFTVTPVNDPPVARQLNGLHNSAYSLSSVIALPISDVDNDDLQVVVQSADTDVATVSVESGRLTITPTGRGNTSIQISASDGEFTASTEFPFTVGEVTRQDVVVLSQDAPSLVALSNGSDRTATFTLTYNGNHAFPSAQAAAEHVVNMPSEEPDEPFPRKLWRFVRDNTYHSVPLTNGHMWNDMWTTMNSLGWGFCSHVAAVYVEIAEAAGYEARVWGLSGHVVPEILWNGRWEMYDPDMAVYFHDRMGNVAGVEQLALDPDLITAPIHPVLPVLAQAQEGAYSPMIAGFYASLADNYIDVGNFRTLEPGGSTLISMPPGSRLTLAGHWTAQPTGYDGSTPFEVPQYRQAALRVPAGWTGELPMPWVIWDIQGTGTVQAGTQSYDVGDPALQSLLQAPSAPLKSITVESNPEGLRLVYLINATWYDALPVNEVSIHGQDVWAITMSERLVEAEIEPGKFPNSLRKPTSAILQ